jgi:hypothetical protein
MHRHGERGNEMSQQLGTGTVAAKRRSFSIDAWAVLLAFVLAALVRVGVFKHIPW